MFVYLCWMFFFSTAESVQTDTGVEQHQGTTSVEMASKFCQNAKQATKKFRQDIPGFDLTAWNKEMLTFEKECERGFLKGFEQSGQLLSSTIVKDRIDASTSKVESLCSTETKKQNISGFGPLHYNMGCIMGGQMRIYQRIQHSSL